MANNPQKSYAAANAEADAIGPLLNSGTLKVYAGTIPARADDSIGSATLLASLALSATAFGSATSGVITANAITSATSTGSGTATFYRCYKSDGTTCVLQGTAGASGCDINFDNAVIAVGVSVSVSAFTYTSQRGA